MVSCPFFNSYRIYCSMCHKVTFCKTVKACFLNQNLGLCICCLYFSFLFLHRLLYVMETCLHDLSTIRRLYGYCWTASIHSIRIWKNYIGWKWGNDTIKKVILHQKSLIYFAVLITDSLIVDSSLRPHLRLFFLEVFVILNCLKILFFLFICPLSRYC